MAQDFRIELGVITNLKPAERQVQDFIRKQGNKEFTLTPKISTKGINEFRDQFQKIKTETSTIQQQIDNLANHSTSVFNKMAKSVEVVKTETDKYRLSNGGLREVITKTNAAGQQFRTIIDKVTDGQGRLVTTTQNLTREQSNGLKYWTQYGEKIEEVVTDYAKAEDETNDLRDKIAQLNKVEEQNVTNTQNMGTAMGETSNHAVTLGQRIVDAAGKVALFKVSTTAVMAFYNAIGDAKDRVVEYDKSLTELKKVWDDAYGSLDNLSKKLSDIGKDTANTLTNMTDIATGIVKAGYSSEEDIAIMSEYVAKLQNTADEELTAAEATSILVSQLKAYHLEAEDASKVTDILNAVSAQQAVSSGDLSKALTVGSAAMATYGNTIEQTTALITAGTTVMQNRSQQVSRGLNMIASKVAANEELLNSYGVALYDASGQLRSTYDVLLDLSDAWETMSTAEQLSVGKTLAGVNQYRVFASVMGQMTIAQEAYQQALSSTGATEKQNAVYMQSLQA